MKTIIIEDEYPAAKRLEEQLYNIDPAIEVLCVIESVDEAVKWFSENESPDLAFVDVQLADGTCFDIFKEIDPACPLIFVTAFDEYAIKAFKLNSIDYLLKPVDSKDLEQSLVKFNRLKGTDSPEASIPDFSVLLKDFRIISNKYKVRFLINIGESYHTVPCSDIAYIHIEDQLVRLTTSDRNTHIICQARP